MAMLPFHFLINCNNEFVLMFSVTNNSPARGILFAHPPSFSSFSHLHNIYIAFQTFIVHSIFCSLPFRHALFIHSLLIIFSSFLRVSLCFLPFLFLFFPFKQNIISYTAIPSSVAFPLFSYFSPFPIFYTSVYPSYSFLFCRM